MGQANPGITLNIYRRVMEHERRSFVFNEEVALPLTELLEPKPRVLN